MESFIQHTTIQNTVFCLPTSTNNVSDGLLKFYILNNNWPLFWKIVIDNMGKQQIMLLMNAILGICCNDSFESEFLVIIFQFIGFIITDAYCCSVYIPGLAKPWIASHMRLTLPSGAARKLILNNSKNILELGHHWKIEWKYEIVLI